VRTVVRKDDNIPRGERNWAIVILDMSAGMALSQQVKEDDVF
jgi:hypothetical protein